MASYWGFRTDPRPTPRDYLASELREGRLRQGWGYREEQDLNVIGPIVYSDGLGALDKHQRATWRRCQRMWPRHWGPIKEGDTLLLPKVPEPGRFTLARVAGGYWYEIGDSGDHGHILPVEILREGIANQNENVESGLQRTLRARSTVWSIDPHASCVEELIDHDEDDLVDAHDELVRLANLQTEMLSSLTEGLLRQFRGNDLEKPVWRLLQALYSDGDVELAAGRSEQGADFVVEHFDPFGNQRRTVMQLKDWDGDAWDQGALSQIELAVKTREASEAILLTTADGEEEEFLRSREELESRLNVPVHFVGRETLMSLFLEHLPELTSGEE